MKQGDVITYKRKVRCDVANVDRAISKGAYLSQEEWFDFLVKSKYVGSKFWNISKYKLFNWRLCSLAEAYAVALEYLMSIAVDGFDNKTYTSILKDVAFLMRKFTDRKYSISVDGFDRDGGFYIRVYIGRHKCTVCPVRNRAEAEKGIRVVVRYCTEMAESFSVNDEFTKFLNGYLNSEFTRFLSNTEPTPYCMEDDRLTLKSQLHYVNNKVSEFKPEDYEDGEVMLSVV